MLAKTVSEHQQDWDQHIPKLLFAYRTAIHKAMGYTPFHVTFGRSPVIPVDIMMGVPVKQKESTVPEFVRCLNSSLKKVYFQVREKIRVADDHNKVRYDQHTTYIHFNIGDQVWLYVAAIKTGRAKKLASLWCGPYTVVHKLNSVTYRIQLLAIPSKTLVVHHNRLKHCFRTPKSPPRYNLQFQQAIRNTPSYCDMSSRQAPAAGYTSSSPDTPATAVPTTNTVPATRPQCTHRPPTRYADFIYH